MVEILVSRIERMVNLEVLYSSNDGAGDTEVAEFVQHQIPGVALGDNRIASTLRIDKHGIFGAAIFHDQREATVGGSHNSDAGITDFLVGYRAKRVRTARDSDGVRAGSVPLDGHTPGAIRVRSEHALSSNRTVVFTVDAVRVGGVAAGEHAINSRRARRGNAVDAGARSRAAVDSNAGRGIPVHPSTGIGSTVDCFAGTHCATEGCGATAALVNHKFLSRHRPRSVDATV